MISYGSREANRRVRENDAGEFRLTSIGVDGKPYTYKFKSWAKARREFDQYRIRDDIIFATLTVIDSNLIRSDEYYVNSDVVKNHTLT